MTRGGQSLGTKELDGAALQRAFKEALGGQHKALDDLFTRYGGLPGRPNAKLAEAFAAEASVSLSAQPTNVLKLLTRLTNDAADADTQRAFLSVAAVYAWCGLLTGAKPRKSAEIEAAWIAIAQLAIDSRLPIRLATVDALVALCMHPGCGETLLQRAVGWLEDDSDREARFGTAAAVLAVLGNAQVVAVVRDYEAMLSYISSAIALIADAPRAAERSEARRRAVRMVPDALCTAMSRMARVSGERGEQWLTHECQIASQPQVRQALSEVLVRLQKDTQGVGRAATERLRKTLEASAAPLRDGVFIRPGTGRGRSSRKIR